MVPIPDDRIGRTQRAVRRLMAEGDTYASIATALGERVSARTVHRWARGEHGAQRLTDLMALERLVTHGGAR